LGHYLSNKTWAIFIRTSRESDLKRVSKPKWTKDFDKNVFYGSFVIQMQILSATQTGLETKPNETKNS